MGSHFRHQPQLTLAVPTGAGETRRVHFVHESLPQRVRFVTGDAAGGVKAEVERLGAARVMVIAAPAEAGLADQVMSGLPAVLRHDEVVMHVPVEVAGRARAAAVVHKADAVVSVGGGSTTGLAKAVAMTTGLPIVPASNPTPVTTENLTALLHAAWAGEEPQ